MYASVEGCPPYDKGSAIATLTAVMTEPLDPPKNAGPLEEVIYGLLAKDPDQRLDDAGARALLTKVLHAPEAPEPPAEPEPAPDATRAVALPPFPRRRRRPSRRIRRPTGCAVRCAPYGTPPRPPSRNRSRGPRAADAVQPRGPRRRGRRSPMWCPAARLVIIAVVVALAVLSTVLYLTLGAATTRAVRRQAPRRQVRFGRGCRTATGPDGKGTAHGQPARARTSRQGRPHGRTDRAGSGGEAGGQPSGGPKTDDPAGRRRAAGRYAMVSNDQFHFTMAMPKGFKLPASRARTPAGYSTATADSRASRSTSTPAPRTTPPPPGAAVPATARQQQRLQAPRDREVEYNGYPTVADWQFERNQGGQRVRVLNRGFKVDATHGYSIMITCKASEWDEHGVRDAAQDGVRHVQAQGLTGHVS